MDLIATRSRPDRHPRSGGPARSLPVLFLAWIAVRPLRNMEVKRAMRYLVSAIALAFLFLSATSVTFAENANQSPASGDVQVIEISAKKYDFTPSSIRVKQGTTVQLKITATDRSHGFKIEEFPEGKAKSGSPGLVLNSSPDCLKIEEGHTQTIEFRAKEPGTYRFKCCVRCGLHHRSMKGELIVEP